MWKVFSQFQSISWLERIQEGLRDLIMTNKNNTTEPNLYPIIFMHIPKTAGTSFRTAARDFYKRRNILRDYGEDSELTSQEIMQFIYNNKDVAKLREASLSYKLITGHFPAAKYKNIFTDAPIVTFVRDPVERVVSHYHHLCSSIGLKCSLRDFYLKKQYQNSQAQLLEGVPFSEMGFVGVTDLYEKSLALFNNKYGTKLEYLEMNKGKYTVSKKPSISQDEKEEIAHLNKIDMELYQLAKDQIIAAWEQQSDKAQEGNSSVLSRRSA